MRLTPLISVVARGDLKDLTVGDDTDDPDRSNSVCAPRDLDRLTLGDGTLVKLEPGESARVVTSGVRGRTESLPV